ncbi:hypothetical protein PY546_15470 [Providencia stuartii]|nr:hypothetical protein [Providencia stuartii]
MISNKLFQRFAPIDPNVSEQLDMLRGFCTATVLFGHAYLVFFISSMAYRDAAAIFIWS